LSRAVISLGSNIDPGRNLPTALARIGAHPDLEVIATSPMYRTAAVGPRGQPEFVNAAVLVETHLDPAALRGLMRSIEAEMGRRRTGESHAPRVIDLDVILCEDFSGEIGGTQVPDPDIGEHAHLAVPAADVAPDWGYGDDGTPLRVIAEPFRDRIERYMSTEPTPLKAERYASEREMEAGVDEVFDAELEGNVRAILLRLGEDLEREGLARTPLRVAKALEFLTSGYKTTVEEVVNNAIFESDADEMVLVKDIEFYSLCEHHMLPFFGKAHVAYMPNKKIIGLSKIGRIVDVFARRLQVQERLTNQIADAIDGILDPHGVAVVMEGSHFCMLMRGVQKQGSSMVTSAMRGGFKENPSSRAEFLELIGR
jgi:GTP cyclohydrolase I